MESYLIQLNIWHTLSFGPSWSVVEALQAEQHVKNKMIPSLLTLTALTKGYFRSATYWIIVVIFNAVTLNCSSQEK